MNKTARLLYAIIFSLAVITGTVKSAPPSWWTDPAAPVVEDGGTAEENYAPANLGQLKNIAKKAAEHLDDELYGGAGEPIWDDYIKKFEPRASQGYTQQEIDAFIAENYAPVNLGQLKRIAKPFYDRLQAAGFDTKASLIRRGFTNVWVSPHNWTGYYPWNPATALADNYAPANIGQLKMVFSFDLAGFDIDRDGLPDAWEMGHLGTIIYSPDDDPDGDGLDNQQEFSQGSNPNNYYSQGTTVIEPVIAIVGGNLQFGPVDEILANPLQVEVRNGEAGPFLENAPVVFTVTAGGGTLLEDSGGSDPTVILTARTSGNGIAEVSFKQGSAIFEMNTVDAQTSPSSVAVTFQSWTSPRNGVWGYWKFNETTGVVAEDSSELANNGALVNSTTWTPRYTGEGGIGFDGAISEGGGNAYVDMGDPSNGSLDFGQSSFSIAFWVKYTDSNTLLGEQGRRIISKGNRGATEGYFIGLLGDGKINSGIGTTVTSNVSETVLFRTADEFDDGEWHHVAVVIDQVEAAGKIYVDGEAKALESVGGSGGTIDVIDNDKAVFGTLAHLSASAVGAAFSVGSYNGTNDFFKGSLDNLQIFRRALTASEVDILFRENGPLTAFSDEVSVSEDEIGEFSLRSAGGGEGAVSFTIVAPPTHGEVYLEGDRVTYYPDAHFYGLDTLRYKVTSEGRSAEADITITVDAVNDAPLVSVGGGQSIILPNTLQLNATVTDIDNSPDEISLLWTADSGPGSVSFSGNTLTAVATFSAPGKYVLRLIANDGLSTRSDSLIVWVNEEDTSGLPQVSIVAPVHNASTLLGAVILVQASSSAASGSSISKVEFYEGARKIGESSAVNSVTSYYELSWTPPRLGVFALSAVSTDNLGRKAFSSSLQVRVTKDGWFTGDEMAGNEGYSGSGGTGGISTNSQTGPGSNHGPDSGSEGGGNSAGGGGNNQGKPESENEEEENDEIRLVGETVDTYLPKHGFSEFAFNGTPIPKLYLKLVVFDQNTLVAHEEWDSITSTTTIDPLTGASTAVSSHGNIWPDMILVNSPTYPPPTPTHWEGNSTFHDAPDTLTKDLSVENTTANLKSNAISKLPPFSDDFSTGFGNAYLNLWDNETAFELAKLRYRWEVTKPALHAEEEICWLEVFISDDEPSKPEIIKVEKWNVNGRSSSPFTIDPYKIKPDVNGSYRISPIEVLGKDKTQIGRLKVANMTGVGVLSGTQSAPVLDIDKDSDRFYVRLPGCANFGSGSIKVSTVDNRDSSYNDNLTEIDLQVEGDDLISKSMLLVSDDVDDDYKVDGIADDANNDRTHKVQLGGKFKIESIKLDGKAYSTDMRVPVGFEKTIKIHAFILQYGVVFMAPVIDPAIVEADMKRVGERMAQCGIKVDYSITTVTSNPSGVVLNTINGLARPNDGYSPPDPVAIPQETKNLFDGLSAAGDEIAIYYVNFMHLDGIPGHTDQPAISTPPTALAAGDISAGYSNKIIISASLRRPFTAAHELLHILLNAFHADYSSEFSKSIMLWKAPTSGSNALNSTKRISDLQSNDAKTKTAYPK